MVSSTAAHAGRLRPVSTLVGFYVAVVVGTVVVLVVLSALHSPLATSDAWIHAVLVAAFAVLLPMRLRAAREGSAGALRAVVVVAAVLLVVNLVEAFLAHLFPTWMRVEMVGIAVLMTLVVVAAARARR